MGEECNAVGQDKGRENERDNELFQVPAGLFVTRISFNCLTNVQISCRMWRRRRKKNAKESRELQ
jgi:hypothetical protein